MSIGYTVIDVPLLIEMLTPVEWMSELWLHYFNLFPKRPSKQSWNVPLELWVTSSHSQPVPRHGRGGGVGVGVGWMSLLQIPLPDTTHTHTHTTEVLGDLKKKFIFRICIRCVSSESFEANKAQQKKSTGLPSSIPREVGFLKKHYAWCLFWLRNPSEPKQWHGQIFTWNKIFSYLRCDTCCVPVIILGLKFHLLGFVHLSLSLSLSPSLSLSLSLSLYWAPLYRIVTPGSDSTIS